MNKIRKYIRIMRFDHWIKQLFILPGCVAAIFLTHFQVTGVFFTKLLIGFFATCFIASANYVINEWLDADFDKYHPTKKRRSAVSENLKGSVIWIMWGCLTVLGFCLSFFVNVPFLIMAAWLWIMGILYNVKPVRTKDIPFLDVLSESVNNAIRLLLGWFVVSAATIPPSSLLLGYWMTGAFLMAIKRFAEYRMIADPIVAGRYRKSFRHYSEKSLLISSFFYAMCSVFFLGIFLIKYRIELVILMPMLIGLYCYYFYISFSPDSSVQKPEKLFREKGLMVYCLILIIVFVILMFVDIPALSILTDSTVIRIPAN